MVAFTFLFEEDPVADRLIKRWDGSFPASGGSGMSAARERVQRLARAVLRALLERETPAQGWDFFADGRGKPFVKARSGKIGPAVSWSHSCRWVACALAERPVGIDIEMHRDRDYFHLAEYAFGPGENDLVRRGDGPAFYRVWTVREAVAKATGDGLACVIDGRDRAHGGPFEGRWTTPARAGVWLLAHECPRAEMSLAIALLCQSGSNWTTESFDRIVPSDLL